MVPTAVLVPEAQKSQVTCSLEDNLVEKATKMLDMVHTHAAER